MTTADIARRHRDRAARFGALIDGVSDWDAPTPVAEWTARDVVAHLTSWFPGFLAAGGIEIPRGDADDPAAAWAAQSRAVQELLDDPDAAESSFSHPMAGTHVLAQAVDMFYTADIFMHSWDLARASGQDDTLDEQTCAAMVAGMESMGEAFRGSGQFGQQQPLPPNASAQDRLIAFIGRDPRWRPPSSR